MQRLYVIFTFLILILQIGISQKTLVVKDIPLFVKNTTNINSNYKHFTLCKDKKLTKNCQYFIQIDNAEYTSTILSPTDINSILKTKVVSQLKNISLEKIVDRTTTPAILRENSIVYLIGFGNNLNIIEYTSPPKTIGRSKSPENIACRKNCYLGKDKCEGDCFRAGSMEQIYQCQDQCAFSYVGCTSICDKYVKKIQIELKGILVKPISFHK